MNINKENLKNRFLSYVKIHTTSDPDSTTYPSTKCQFDLANKLVEELKELGLENIKLDEYGYVTATLPGNTDVSPIGFLAHMDTSNQASGENVNPQIHANYDGSDIILKDGITLSPSEFPALKNYVGQELITTDGTTLLGADNKAGIAVIMTALETLKNNDLKHGPIRIGFTPDEEIGRGVDYFDVKGFDAEFAYTMDGGEIGELEDESFNAAAAKIEITGKSVHPGTAKNIMVNAALIAADIINAFPPLETPEHTEMYEGFYLITRGEVSIEKAELHYIIRDHNKEKFEMRKKFVQDTIRKFNQKYEDRIELTLTDSYYNMKDVLVNHPHVIDLAEKAIRKAGIKPIRNPIRGGTDGCRLSFMGLPCPNIFTGGHNYHGPYEYVPVESMIKSVEVVLNIAEMHAS
ncbi:MAG: peptidase T [Defluviitaleaceae bacterium]|nr:peptidase T [Defluviitaleaceae bacterium]